MLDKDDIQIIKQLLDDQARDLRDYVKQENVALENRMDKKMEKLEKNILNGMAEMLDDAVLPQIANHDERLEKLEQTVYVGR